MDTDVEVVKPLDELLAYAAFSGYESMPYISTGIMGAEKHNSWIAALLREYETIHFVKPDGSYDLTTNVHRITNWTKNFINTPQMVKCELDGNIAIFHLNTSAQNHSRQVNFLNQMRRMHPSFCGFVAFRGGGKGKGVISKKLSFRYGPIYQSNA